MIMIYFKTGNDRVWVELMGILFCTQRGAPGARGPEPRMQWGPEAPGSRAPRAPGRWGPDGADK